VSFPSGDSTLRGYVHGPEGAGPFPAIIWNHGSERLPGSCADLGSFYTSAGYVFFVPHRHGHGQSPGEYPLGTVPTRARAQTEDTAGYRRKGIELLIELHEAYLEHTVAAVKWLKRQPFVDSTRMAMSGVSHGGIQTVLAAEADAGMKAYVPFAPAAIAWRGNPELQDRLLCAVQTAHAPMFLLQARTITASAQARSWVESSSARGRQTGHGYIRRTDRPKIRAMGRSHVRGRVFGAPTYALFSMKF
jgi:carboxymethylenebutenolidase